MTCSFQKLINRPQWDGFKFEDRRFKEKSVSRADFFKLFLRLKMLCDEKPAAVSDAWFTLWRDDGWRIAVCVNFRRGKPRGMDEVDG